MMSKRSQSHASHAFRRGQIEALIWAGFTTAQAIAPRIGVSVEVVRHHLRQMSSVTHTEVRNGGNMPLKTFQLRSA